MKFSKYRLEQFSDGVMSIIVTIMVLNIPLPHHFAFSDLFSLLTSVLVYFVSFFIVGFFWHQHYRIFHMIDEISSMISWRNMLFLFSLSLMPVFTKWVIENMGKVIPALGYAIVFIFVNLSCQLLLSCARKQSGEKDFHMPRKFFIIFSCSWILVSSGLIVLCFLQPLIASVLLIGLPLLFSLSNLWFEHPRRENRRLAAYKKGASGWNKTNKAQNGRHTPQ